MRSSRNTTAILAAMTLLFLSVTLLRARASGQKQPPTPAPTARLNIQLTAGDENKPLADASIYLRFVVQREHHRDEKVELNLKTNLEGLAHSPEIPQGKVLIQIVAPGWKTYGQYYDVQTGEQTVQIHLGRPGTKWY